MLDAVGLARAGEPLLERVVPRDPDAGAHHRRLVLVVDLPSAALACKPCLALDAHIARGCHALAIPVQVAPPQRLECLAMRARQQERALVAVLVFARDQAVARRRRRGQKDQVRARVGVRALGQQRERVRLFAGPARPLVDLVAADDADRDGREVGRALRRAEVEHGPAERDLARLRVVRAVGELVAQARARMDHRQDAPLGGEASVVCARHDEHRRRRLLVDEVAEHVVRGLGLADLRARHDRDAADPLRGRGVHPLARVWRSVGAPSAGLGGKALVEDAVLVGPLRDRQPARLPECGEDVRVSQ